MAWVIEGTVKPFKPKQQSYKGSVFLPRVSILLNILQYRVLYSYFVHSATSPVPKMVISLHIPNSHLKYIGLTQH
jgi:hypothetical protein